MTVHSTPLEAAAEWRRRVAEGFTAQDAAEFAAWEAIPQNAGAYQQVERAWNAFDREDDLGVERLRRETLVRLRQRRRIKFVGRIAATVLVAVGVGGVYWSQRGQVYTNDGASPRIVALQDGSNLTIDAQSVVKVRYTSKLRHFDLERGQASFQVASNPSRPFEVKVGKATVAALGTTFNINRWGGGATIVLLEGKVRVGVDSNADGAVLSPGQEVTVQGDRLSSIAPARLRAVEAWKSGVLIFNDESLLEALASVNRYGDEPIRLSEPELGDLRISGLFRAGDTGAFYRGVAEIHGLRTEVGAKEIILRRRE